MGLIAKTFVLANRIFGQSAILGGGITTIAAIVRGVRGDFATFAGWMWVALGLGLIGVGFVYVRVPLMRRSRRTKVGAGRDR